MRSKAVLPLLAISLAALPLGARPCSLCSAGDPLVAASDAPSRAGEVRLGLEADWQRADAASEADPAMRDEVDQRSVRLVVVYGPLERLNLFVALPWTWKETRHVGGGMDMPHARAGIGDAELGARWFLLQKTDWGAAQRHVVALSAGSSLPTGEADASEGGVRLDDHAQLGSGGFGPYAGVLYRLEQPRWNLLASVTGRWRTENRWGFRPGPSLTWSLQGQWNPHERFAAGLGIDGREAARDEVDGAPVGNTGGMVLAATPGLWFGLTESLWVSLRAQLPVATSLVGDQWVGPVVTAGLQWIAH